MQDLKGLRGNALPFLKANLYYSSQQPTQTHQVSFYTFCSFRLIYLTKSTINDTFDSQKEVAEQKDGNDPLLSQFHHSNQHRPIH